jgi:hypothetical protein
MASVVVRPSKLLLALLVAAMAASPRALAYDPSPLQDFCVADTASNGTCCTVHVRAA